MSPVQSFRRHLLIVLAGASALLCVWTAAARGETIYGGLGGVGAPLPALENAHKHGQVANSGQRAFAVDSDGSYFIGDEFEIEEKGEEKHFIRVQKFDSKGKFLSENRIETPATPEFEGFAIDPEKHRLYLLVVESGVADELWSFSTEVSSEKLKEQQLLAGEKVLNALSAELKLPLHNPTGIAVDPVTHDVLILGQQNQAATVGAEELVAAAQRVHTEGAHAGELGPRYVDTANCLGEVPSAEEQKAKEEAEAKGETVILPCAEGTGAEPFAPAVSPTGKLYAQRVGGRGEIWELLSTEGAAEAFALGEKPKEYPARPRRLFSLLEEAEKTGASQEILEIEGSESEGERNTMSIASGPGGTSIYLDAKYVEKETGEAVLILGLTESGTPEAHETGWTAGLAQAEREQHEKCALLFSNAVPMIGADGKEDALMFVVGEEKGKEEGVVQRFGFGSGSEVEACAHASATPPRVEFGLSKEVTKVPVGKETTLVSEVIGANAKSVEWKFKNTTSGAPEETVATGYQARKPMLEKHVFEEAGSYEITEIVVPDDFGPKLEEHTTLTVEAEPVTVDFSRVEPITAGKATTFTAHLKDVNEKSPRVKYVWVYGDGTKSSEEDGGTEFKTEHTYAGAGSYEAKLEVTDKGGRKAEAKHTVTVSATGGGGGGGNGGGGGGTGGGSTGGGNTGGGNTGGGTTGGGEVKGFQEIHNPDATLAGASLSASPAGAVTLTVTCPAGESDCSGTVTLRTLGAVSARAAGHKKGKKHRAAVLTLASGSFSVAGGKLQTVTLHLSAKARALLARSHVLRAQATLVAHDSSGATHTTQTVVTLRIAKPSHRRKH